jgi:hypothetical protein
MLPVCPDFLWHGRQVVAPALSHGEQKFFLLQKCWADNDYPVSVLQDHTHYAYGFGGDDDTCCSYGNTSIDVQNSHTEHLLYRFLIVISSAFLFSWF